MKRLVLCLVAFVITAAGGVVTAGRVDDEATLKQVLDYRHWALVNPEPLTTGIPASLTRTLDLRSLPD